MSGFPCFLLQKHLLKRSSRLKSASRILNQDIDLLQTGSPNPQHQYIQYTLFPLHKIFTKALGCNTKRITTFRLAMIDEEFVCKMKAWNVSAFEVLQTFYKLAWWIEAQPRFKQNKSILVFSFSKADWTVMSSSVIDLMDWANEAGEKEKSEKDGDADPDEVEVGQADVLAHRLPRVVVALVSWAEAPQKSLVRLGCTWQTHLSLIWPSSIPSLHFNPFVFPEI